MGWAGEVSRVWRVSCISVLAGPDPSGGRCVLPQGELVWEVQRVAPDLDSIRRLLREQLEHADAVALRGITTSFMIAGRRYRHEYLWHVLGLDELDGRFFDGSTLAATLERHLVRQAAEELRPLVAGKRVLFFSGLDRYGSAEVLSTYTRRIIFGDLLYGLRLGIPITSFHALVASAPQLVRAVSQAPAQWFWPSARRKPRFMPRYHYYFRGADVIVGDISYFYRYAPSRLAGKVVFAALQGPEDVDLFREKGVRVLVSLTPEVGGAMVPVPVLEAGLHLASGDGGSPPHADALLNQLQEMDLSPRIYYFASEDQEPALALARLPVKETEPLAPRSPEELDLTPGEDVAKFAFVIHPLSFRDVRRLAIVRALARFVPERLIEDAVAYLPPFPVGVVRGITSPTGARAEGVLYAVPMTSKAILRFPPGFMYRKLEQVARQAEGLGCRLMGLGAYTSVVGDAGVTVSQRVSIGVTSGNSFTVACTLRTLELTAAICGIDLGKSAVLVIGATGSIGSICARLLAPKVRELQLVGPRPEKLLALASLISRETPRMQGRIKLSRLAADYLPSADAIITTTSAVDPVVDVSLLKPGCVVCDVARPPDIKPEAARARDDILVVESGEVRLPAGAELTYDIGLPPMTIYACLAETAILALDRRFGHFTLGREIDPAKVQLIAELGAKHGFELAPVRSFGQVVDSSRYRRLVEANASRIAVC